jgi:hypothetical protein
MSATMQKPNPLQLAPAPQMVDYPAIKQRQQRTWASGDYAVIGTTLQIVGETLAETVNLLAGAPAGGNQRGNPGRARHHRIRRAYRGDRSQAGSR